MNVLVLGSGGREHALVWKISQSPMVKKLYCIPGNPGIAKLAECQKIDLGDFAAIELFITGRQIDLAIVGPEQPLVEGIVDYLQAKGHAVFGPDKHAAQLEGSKIFAKNFLQKYKIPSARFADFTDYNKAITYLNSLEDGMIVIKADGLAAGKGSVVCKNKKEAGAVLKSMMVGKQFGDAGQQVLIEEYLEGREASLFLILDGKNYVALSPAQDYKRALDGDLGKNTGGMGSFAPTPVLSKTMLDRAISEIVEPVLSGLRFEGISFKGVLYVGLMITESGPHVIEFNCRFGDPETQVVLPLLKSDLMEILLASVQGSLDRQKVEFKDQYAVCVIAASGGYPDAYRKGKHISGLDKVDDEVLVFHAGTGREGQNIVTSGGRVLGITALDKNLKTAIGKVYANMEKIHFEGMQYRRDIAEHGWKLVL
jgi:phosphoribosylamine---glycine ligase